jgi:hypothetical protein
MAHSYALYIEIAPPQRTGYAVQHARPVLYQRYQNMFPIQLICLH